MERIILAIFAVAFVRQATGEMPTDIGSILTNSIAKDFGDKLNQHIKTIQEEYQPIVDVLKDNKCYPEDSHIASEGSVQRWGACSDLTIQVGEFERSFLDFHHISKWYIWETQLASKNVTTCLERTHFFNSSICLLNTANYYGSKIGFLNNWLARTLSFVEFWIASIPKLFNNCFKADATLNEIVNVYTEKCKSRS